jgi:hypothetical protein
MTGEGEHLSRQKGFFLSGNGEKFRTRPEKGDKMIKPKERKRKKRWSDDQRAVFAFMRREKAYEDWGGRTELETPEGGKTVVERTRGADQYSYIGESEGVSGQKVIDRPSKPDLSELTPQQIRMYFAIKKDQARRAEEKREEKGVIPGTAITGFQQNPDAVGYHPDEPGVDEKTPERLAKMAAEAKRALNEK